jgi:molecular chaperone DnaK
VVPRPSPALGKAPMAAQAPAKLGKIPLVKQAQVKPPIADIDGALRDFMIEASPRNASPAAPAVVEEASFDFDLEITPSSKPKPGAAPPLPAVALRTSRAGGEDKHVIKPLRGAQPPLPRDDDDVIPPLPPFPTSPAAVPAPLPAFPPFPPLEEAPESIEFLEPELPSPEEFADPLRPLPVAAPARAAPLLIDVTPISLGVEVAGGFCDFLIRANTPVPCDRTRVFRTASDNQVAVRVRVVQGESQRFSENTYLGDLELSGLPAAARGEVEVAVTFEIDADGILNVRAKDEASGRETVARMNLLGAQTDTDEVAAMMARQRKHEVA